MNLRTTLRRLADKNLAVQEAAPVHVYCTKHILSQPLPGGPDRLVWVYGPAPDPRQRLRRPRAGPNHRLKETRSP